jgi:hypothetical protein
LIERLAPDTEAGVFAERAALAALAALVRDCVRPSELGVAIGAYEPEAIEGTDMDPPIGGVGAT